VIARKAGATPVPAATPAPSPELGRRFPAGQLVTVKGLPGRYRVRGWNPDGSVRLYGGSRGRLAARSVTPDRLTRKRHDPEAVAS